MCQWSLSDPSYCGSCALQLLNLSASLNLSSPSTPLPRVWLCVSCRSFLPPQFIGTGFYHRRPSLPFPTFPHGLRSQAWLPNVQHCLRWQFLRPRNSQFPIRCLKTARNPLERRQLYCLPRDRIPCLEQRSHHRSIQVRLAPHRAYSRSCPASSHF